MRIAPLIALGLCVSPVCAQPDAVTKARPTSFTASLPTAPKSAEKAVRNFVDDANHNDFVGDQQRIYGARHGFFGANEWSRKPKPWGACDIVIQSVSAPQIKTDGATVVVKYHLESRKNEKGEFLATKAEREAGARQQSETLFLKMAPSFYEPNSKDWLIVPPSTEPKFVKGGPLLNFVVYKMAQKPLLQSSSGEESLKRLKALGLAALQFAQDFDDQFAFAPEYAREALFPYLEEAQSWEVPGTLDAYTFNASLSQRYVPALGTEGTVFTKPPTPFIKDLGKTVMFYEGHDQKPIFRYDGKAAICFADGHTALVTPEEAHNLVWNPA